MIDLKQLIAVAPLSQEVKNDVLQKADSLTPDQKLDIERTCWDLIIQEYQNKIGLLREKSLLGNFDGSPTLSVEDVKKEEEKLFLELVQKLNAAETQEDIQEIREKLTQVQNEQS